MMVSQKVVIPVKTGVQPFRDYPKTLDRSLAQLAYLRLSPE